MFHLIALAYLVALGALVSCGPLAPPTPTPARSDAPLAVRPSGAPTATTVASTASVLPAASALAREVDAAGVSGQQVTAIPLQARAEPLATVATSVDPPRGSVQLATEAVPRPGGGAAADPPTPPADPRSSTASTAPPANPASSAPAVARVGGEAPGARPATAATGSPASPAPGAPVGLVATVAPTTPSPTSTPAPTVTTRTGASPTPVASPAPRTTPTATAIPGAVAEAEGEWVTSRDPRARYFAQRSDTYWRRWSAANRVWFRTREALLAAFPGRTPAPR